MSTVSPDGARIVAGITRAVVNFGPAAREGDRVQGVLTFFHSLLDEDVLLLEAIDLLPAGTVPGSQRAIAVAGRLASIMYELAMLCSPNVMRHRDAAAAAAHALSERQGGHRNPSPCQHLPRLLGGARGRGGCGAHREAGVSVCVRVYRES